MIEEDSDIVATTEVIKQHSKLQVAGHSVVSLC